MTSNRMASTRDLALHALNRFGLGARPGEADRIDDPIRWLEVQLAGDPPVLGASGRRLDDDNAAGAMEAFRSTRLARDPDARMEARRRVRELLIAESRSALSERVATERPFAERLVAFWSNHLCVSVAAKPILAPLAGAYERNAIRPHVFGRFEELVLASARHPAMLVYLDNAQSIGPESPAGRMTARRGRERGLNENYARELLELHTLGVNGGYGQTDVLELARILTGWTIAGSRASARRRGSAGFASDFRFLPLAHEPGPKTVLGVRYEQGGEAEGEAVIRSLCRHTSTARFVAEKLVRHFVADDPPPDAIRGVAAVFTETGGDLRAVSRSLIGLDDAWDPDHRKFRTPQEWLVAALRALGAREAPPPAPLLLRQLRHPLWSPPSPKGYGDIRREWGDPDALMNRAELARSLAGPTSAGGTDPARLLDVVPVTTRSPFARLVSDAGIDPGERVALALAGPDFQWR